MEFYTRFAFLKQYSDLVGSVYGTEDFAVWLYSTIKMMRPKTVVELGTGLGITALWAGFALQENGEGTLHTIDNGSEWPQLHPLQLKLGDLYHKDYKTFIERLITLLKLDSHIKFQCTDISTASIPTEIDILFSDFSHGPKEIVHLLREFLPRMSSNSMLLFDSASTYYPSYALLEQLVQLWNSGHLPSELYSERLYHKTKHCSMQLQHLIESKERAQNSTACLRIIPRSVFPPSNHVRF
jgi:predicted O-methyltransferase YrrM